jgi:hypothetical protein
LLFGRFLTAECGLNANWGDYFGGQVVSTTHEIGGFPMTEFRTFPMDQPALVGLVNRLNGLGLRLLLVKHERVEDED